MNNKFDKRKESLIRRYNLYIEDYDSDLTFEDFLIVETLSLDDQIDALLTELKKYNPPYLEEVDEIIEEFLEPLKKTDKEFEEKFKEEYQ
tara:strand:+ start:25 stop:294 length:270 start_codon:yes stop_codon:yes gene_type:complete